MDTIRTLVRNLVVILLLAAFLDLLLPSNTMRKFVKLVMGLFVIAALLNPLAAFLHAPLAMEIPAWTTLPSGDLPVIASEGDGSQIGRNVVQEQYRIILSRQILSLVVGIDGIEQAEVEVTMEEGRGTMLEQPKLREVIITVKREADDLKPIQPITVSGETVEPESEEWIELIKNRVHTFLEIPVEKILIKEK